MEYFFTHLKLWVAVERPNFKWVKIKFYNLALLRVDLNLTYYETNFLEIALV